MASFLSAAVGTSVSVPMRLGRLATNDALPVSMSSLARFMLSVAGSQLLGVRLGTWVQRAASPDG